MSTWSLTYRQSVCSSDSRVTNISKSFTYRMAAKTSWNRYGRKLHHCHRHAFSALTLLVGRQEGHPACKKTEWLGAGVVICLERGADLHMAQLMPLPLTVSCFGKIQIGFTFLVPAHPGGPGQRAIKRVCVCVCVCVCYVTVDLCIT